MKTQEQLDRYKQKRKFDQTSEPEGEKESSSRIYAIQEHHATRLHYDLRLENDGVLLSWAVTKEPTSDSTIKRLAIRVEDHPVEYATFSGTIPKGNYGAGTVSIWDDGTWSPATDDVSKALADGELKFDIQGKKLKGSWVLVRMGEPSDKEQWLLIKEKHERHLEPVHEWNENGYPEVQLCELRNKMPSSEDWRFEVKWDGYRALLIVENGSAKFVSRNHNEIKLPKLCAKIEPLISQDAIIDGELVVLNKEGRSEFGLLQKALHSGETNIRFVAFDLLRSNNEDFRSQELRTRIKRLEDVVDQSEKQAIMLSPDLTGDPKTILEKACELNLEGIVAKKLSSSYSGRRSSDWVKIKCRRVDDGVIIGYKLLEGSTKAIGALLIAKGDATGYKFIGRVGTGFNESERERLFQMLHPETQTNPPIENLPRAQVKGVIWVKPKHEITYEFAEITGDGMLRQASYKGEKKPNSEPALMPSPETINSQTKKPNMNSTTKEEITIKLSSPEREIDKASGETKQDLFDYYRDVYELMEPFITSRAFSLLRCPEGLAEECFFQKHLTGTHLVALKEFEGNDEKLILINSKNALLEAVQMGVIEFHSWGSKITDLEKPDMLTFDLDPGEKVDWSQVLESTELVKKVLESIGLRPYFKLSGGKGIHAVVTIRPELVWDAAKQFCKSIAEKLVSDHPSLFLAHAAKKDRTEKIYIDYLRNGRGATAINAYSLRARPTLPVAMPLSWHALLNSNSSVDFNITNALDHVKKRTENPWSDIFDKVPSLKQILRL